MDERIRTCCFSGHRDLPADEIKDLQVRLTNEIRKLVKNGVTRFIAGGAVGFDMMAAICVLNLKASDFPNLHLTLALPCPRHFGKWQESDKQMLLHLLERSDEVVFVSDEYQPGCMQKRNRYMVDHAEYLLCYHTKKEGGTAYTVNYAKRNGLSVTNVAQYVQTSLPI